MVLKTEKAEYWMRKDQDDSILKILSDRTKKLYKKSGPDQEQYPGISIGKFERLQKNFGFGHRIQLNVFTIYELYERNDKLLLSTLWALGFGERSIYTCIWESNQNKKH